MWILLMTAWLLGAAWSIATVPSSRAFPLSDDSFSNVDLHQPTGDTQFIRWPAPEATDSRDGHDTDEQVEPETPARKRGIRPPWRENAIPELRRQPGQKPKASTA